MSRPRGALRKNFVLMIVALAVVSMILTVWTLRDHVLESWYLRRVDSSDLSITRNALVHLGRLRSERVIPRLKTLVTDGSELAVPALICLVRIGPPAVDTLQALLRNEAQTRPTFDASIAAVGKLGAEAVPALLELLRCEVSFLPGPCWPAEALVATGASGDTLAKFLVENGIDSRLPYPPIRGAIFVLANSTPSRRTVEALGFVLLNSTDASVRGLAARSLTRLGPAAEAATPDLLTALRDESPGVAVAAARAVVAIGPPTLPALLPALRDANQSVRLGVIFSLAENGTEAAIAVPLLTVALEEEDRYVRLHAIEELRKFGAAAKSATPALREQLSSEHPRLRAAAARALSEIGE